MSIGRLKLSDLLGRLVSESPAKREEAAETVSDWSRSLDHFEVKMLARILSLVASYETVAVSRESEMNALVNIFNPDVVNMSDIEPVLTIDPGSLGPSELEYLNELRELLA